MIDTATTPPKLARTLGVTADKIRAWINSGELVAVDLATRRGGRRRLRIMPADLDAFLRRRRVVPASSGKRRKREQERPDFVRYYGK